MASHYFIDAVVDQWSLKTTYQDLERENLHLSMHQVLWMLKQRLNEIAKAKDWRINIILLHVKLDVT